MRILPMYMRIMRVQPQQIVTTSGQVSNLAVGGEVIFAPPLYMAFVILHTKQTRGTEHDSRAHGQTNRRSVRNESSTLCPESP